MIPNTTSTLSNMRYSKKCCETCLHKHRPRWEHLFHNSWAANRWMAPRCHQQSGPPNLEKHWAENMDAFEVETWKPSVVASSFMHRLLQLFKKQFIAFERLHAHLWDAAGVVKMWKASHQPQALAGAYLPFKKIRRPCLALAKAGRRPGPPLVWSFALATKPFQSPGTCKPFQGLAAPPAVVPPQQARSQTIFL